MAHKHVSNKAVMQNKSFLSQLGSTLSGRVPPQHVETRSSIAWHRTSDVTDRIKTSTGTIAIYDDMTDTEIHQIKQQAAAVGVGDVTDLPPSAVAEAIFDAAKAAAEAGPASVDADMIYVALEDYNSDGTEGLSVVRGQKLLLIDSSSPHKRAKIDAGEEDQDGGQLLDNTAARHKMAIRPKKHHPDPRSRAQDIHEERWLMKDAEGTLEGYIPSIMLEKAAPGTMILTSTAGTTKKTTTIQTISLEKTVEKKRSLMTEIRQGKVLKKSTSRGKVSGPQSPEDEARAKRAATIRELIETEEEFVKDLKYVMAKYYTHIESPLSPRHVTDNKDIIFNNFKFIADFHQNVLIEGVKYNADTPRMIGKTFLRLERDFDQHADYCGREPLSQEFLDNNQPVREHFEDYSQQIGDDKRLQEHLKLPIQRLNDYQLLLKELVKYSGRLGDDTSDLQRALELMQTLPQRATDTKFISSIEGFKGNLLRLGRLIRHDWWTVSEVGHKPHERYLFLFNARILITKVKRISDERSVFVLKDIIRLPETALGDLDRPRALELHHIEPHSHPNFPYVIEAKNEDIRDAWLTTIGEHVIDTASVEDLLFDDEIRVVSLEGDDEDFGAASPPAEDQEFEDLPEDIPVSTKGTELKSIEEVSSFKESETVVETIVEVKRSLPERDPSPPRKKVALDIKEDVKQSKTEEIKPISITKEKLIQSKIEETEAQVDFWASKSAKEDKPVDVTPKKEKEEEEPISIKKEVIHISPEEKPVILEQKQASSKPGQQAPSKATVEASVKGLVKSPEQVEEPQSRAEQVSSASKLQEVKTPQITSKKPEAEPKKAVVKSPEPVKPIESAPVAPTKPIEPVTKSAAPVVPAKVIEPVAPAKSAAPVVPAKVVESVAPVKSAAPVVPAKVVEPVAPAKSAAPVVPAKVVEPVTPAKTVTPAKPSVPAAPAPTKPKLELKTDLKPSTPAQVTPQSAKMSEPTTPMTPGTGPRPIFLKSLVGDVIEPGDGTSFTCEMAHPIPYHITWLKDNMPLDDKLADRVKQIDAGKRHILKVLNCRTDDSGTYTAKATDSANCSATSSAQLLVHELTEQERAARTADKSPFFMVKMKPTEVIENTDLSYAVHIKGDPMPTVTFYKDNEVLNEDERIRIKRDEEKGKYWIVMTHVTKDDAGKYKCIAMNKFGRAECEATVNVADEIYALQKLAGKGSLLQPGEKADFKWFRDGQEFTDPLERFNVHFKDEEDTLALVFQNVTPEDAGLYTCVASTSCGKISCSAELTVEGAVNRLLRDPEAPMVKEPLLNTTVSAGGSAMLECKIGGYPKPELAWTRSGLDVKMGPRIKMLWEDEETVTLVIKNATEQDAGTYRVLAVNELGEIDSECKLSIRAGPKIKKMQKEVACKVGVTLDYSVEVDGEPAPVIRWMKDGKELICTDRIKLSQGDDKRTWKMKIESMTLEDCGVYSVVAGNDVGQVTEQFTVEADAPPVISRGLDPETEKKMNNDHTFEVRCTGSPKPLVRWFKNSKELDSDGDKYKILKDESFYMLKIRNLSRQDKGTYRVELENSSGKAQSEGNLVIRAPPDFKTPLKDNCAKEGAKDVKMFAEWEANPKPTIKVFFNDKPVREETPGFVIKILESTLLLTISEATAEFCGTYTVKASNEYGENVCKAMFRLHELPIIVDPLTDMEFLEESNCKFTFKATGVPMPDLKWTKDGKKWSPDDRKVKQKKDGEDVYILTFEEISTDDSGLYVASLTNVEGTATTEGTIIVNTPPHIKKSNFKDGKKFVAHHKCILEVEATAVPEATATWFVNGRELKEEEDNVKFTFDGKKYILERFKSDPEHSGEYVCKLKNKIQEVDETGIVTIVEKEARIRVPLENVFVRENLNAELKCQIVGDPIPAIEWLRNGKPIPPSERFDITEERDTRWHYLTMKEVTERDKCSFSVRAKNTHGSCETICQLGILVKPVPGELQDTTVDFGKELALAVCIHAFPPPEIKWFLNGSELRDCEHSRYLRDEEKELYTLVVNNVVLEDGGTYKYTATNPAGAATYSCGVKIHTEIPAVLRGIEETPVCLEDCAIIRLLASGLPLPEVEWRNKGTVLKPSSKYEMLNPEPGVYELHVKDLAMEDYGTIQVVAKSLVGETNSTAQLKQDLMPCEIIEGLENITNGAEGEDVSVTVKIRASPRPSFTWSKDGDTIEESQKLNMTLERLSFCEANITLTLNEASSIEGGQYRMKITNELNEASSETALIIRPVRSKPKISRKPEDFEVTEKEAGKFKSKISGFPKPDVKWTRDGRPVHQTDLLSWGVTADGYYYLEFKHVTMEDAGRYCVTASNEEGVSEAEATLIVNPPPSKPEFLQGLKSVKVINGYPCRMEVKLGGFPLPTVTCQDPLAETNMDQLLLARTRQKPEDRKKSKAANQWFFALSWLKDGKPLEVDGTHYRETVAADGTVTLTIAKCSEADHGSYTCLAKNNEGESETTGKLSVLGMKRDDGQPDGASCITETLKDQCFDEGKTLRLPVALKGGPVPSMKWYKNGNEIKVDGRTFFTYDGDRAFLEIRPCVGDDGGIYKCVVENEFGSTETECEISVRKCFEPPSFSSAFMNKEQLPGKDVKFTVRLDGVPKPEISWYHNDELIRPDGDKYRLRKDGDSTTLYVREVTYSDSGVWKCIAKNREGSVEHQADLVVSDDVDPNRKVEAPVFLKTIGDQELYEGYTARFKAIVSGKPLPDFQWYKNGTKFLPTNRMVVERDNDGLIRLTIKYVTLEDAATYELKCSNVHGSASCSGKLICESLTSRKKRPVGDEYMGFDKVRRSGVPMPLPEKPFISALGDRRATISWVPYLPQGPTIPVTYQMEMLECPEGDWFTVRSGVRGCSLDVTSLGSKVDYKFRIRVENKFGVSEPSPYVATYRNKLERDPLCYEPSLEMNTDQMGNGPYVPTGFNINRDIHGNFFAAPRFLRVAHDTQYGMKNFNTKIKWYAFGYPNPKVRFFFKDNQLDITGTGRHTSVQEATGEITLFIDKVTEADVGWYDCLVSNEYGESRQRIRLMLAEYPKVTDHLKPITMRGHATGRIACKIAAYPPCDVTWYKDWEPMAPTFRLRAQFIDPDTYVLNFHGAVIRDSGLYSIAATNVAGTVTSSCFVSVDEDVNSFVWTGPSRGKMVEANLRRGTLEDHYDVGDELGRGTQGVVYHCSEHFTGRNYAAKSMWGDDKYKLWMLLEMENMNLLNTCKHIVRLYDAYESSKNVLLVTELCSGGDLLYGLCQSQYITEYEIALYMKQVLLGLEYIHDRTMAHCGLNVGDILLTHPYSTEIKISDLSLTRHIRQNKMYPLDYGMPEFVAPEVANGQNVGYAADMWAVGVITYLLLSGSSPFRGDNDRETLTSVQKGEMKFDMAAFREISEEAKDFITRLLQFRVDSRMDVKAALCHPWMEFANMSPREPYRINTDKLRTYNLRFREWYANASCRRWFRRRPLASAFTHPSKMVYPPGEVYTPPESPERDVVPSSGEIDFSIPQRDLSYELDIIKSDSHYQSGPDTYLLQLRDVDFPVRVRQYMKVAAHRSPSYAASIKQNNYDYNKIPVIHERRRFTDIMDEEIDEERGKRTMVDKYTSSFVRSAKETCSLDLPRRVKNELSIRRAIKDEDPNAVLEMIVDGKPPFIREKPQTTAIVNGKPITLTVVFTADPEPTLQWYKNDVILGESSRMMITNESCKSTLEIAQCHEMDAGLYKFVVRNILGQAVHKLRLVQGVIPGPCDSPQVVDVSDSQIVLKWYGPKDECGSYNVSYQLEIKPQDSRETDWVKVADNITHEFYLVTTLQPSTTYQFRVAAHNLMGWGEFSVSTSAIRTAPEGTPRVSTMTPLMIAQQQATDDGRPMVAETPQSPLDYSKEDDHIKEKKGDGAELQMCKYKFLNKISKGRFSVLSKTLRQDDQRTFAAKVLSRVNREEDVKREFDIGKTFRHERLATLFEAYHLDNATVFVMEFLAGEVDVLTYLSQKLEYSEQHVATIVRQILDGLSYLHWRGYCHLDIQPDNVVLTSPRRCDVKLVDFGCAQPVRKLGSNVPVNGLLDYIAPEVMNDKKAYPNSDVWSLGVLTYVLMAGVSPFLGESDEETMDNISNVRYRFECLHQNVTQEATRFIMLVFKRESSKRPTVDECFEHRWLVEDEFMVKKREKAVMQSYRLQEYNGEYHGKRDALASSNSLDILSIGKHKS